MPAAFPPSDVAGLTNDLTATGYIPDRGLATAAFLALKLGRPLLLEGEVGVGKTELAKTFAAMFNRDLIRLQCFEGIDAGQALYEWDYARQMLAVRALSGVQGTDVLLSTTSSVSHISSSGRFLARSRPVTALCFSLMRSIVLMMSSRHSSSSYSQISR